MSRLNASAPCGRKKGSFFPQTARKGGLGVLAVENVYAVDIHLPVRDGVHTKSVRPYERCLQLARRH
jgi:hypothetical protein